MPPRGYKKSNPDEQAQLLTAARSVVSVLCASAPDNMDLRMAHSCLEHAGRSLAPDSGEFADAVATAIKNNARGLGTAVRRAVQAPVAPLLVAGTEG